MNKNHLHHYGQLADTYDETRYNNVSDQFIDHFREMVFLELLQPHKSMSIIDVGTGTGSGIFFFAKNVGQVIGLDGTQEMLDIAQEKIAKAGLNNVELVCSNALEIPYDENTFDHVVSLNFIHLFSPKGLEMQKKFVAEMKRVVKPGGSIIVEYDNIAYMAELGNKYRDLFVIGSDLDLEVENVLGTYLPKTLLLSKASKRVAEYYGGLAKTALLRRFAYRWVVKYSKSV